MTVLTLHKPAEAPQLELRPAADLLPYARNSNTHPPGQIVKLRQSIAEFGWTNPVLVDESGGVVAGHGRLLAYAQLLAAGETARFPSGAPIPAGMVPVLSCAGWTDAQRRAYVIADNRIAAESVLDDAVLALEVTDLSALGFDLALTGLDDDEVSELLALAAPEPETEADPEAVPPLADEAVSVLGDVWVCGPHRIACGDCADPAVVDALMRGELADLCVTDPPYNMDLGFKQRKLDKTDRLSRAKHGDIANDKMSPAEFRDALAGWFGSMFAVMKPGAPMYVAHADAAGLEFRQAVIDAGFKFSSCLIWRKNQMTLGHADWQWAHEPILYGWKPGAAHRWYGGRKRTTVIDWGESGPVRRLEDGRWAITVGDSTLIVDGQATLEELPGSVIYHDKPSRSELHPTTKPVGLWEKLIKPSGRPGDIVIDWFSGSGTTMIAADRMGLIARVIELDPKYVDVGVRRWQMLTGRRAVHAVTGQPFPADGETRAVAPEPSDTHDTEPF